jgi:hypothetical protein
MKQRAASLTAALAVAAAVTPVSSAHPSGWWWTVQQANQTTFWWSATHHLDTTCKGIGPSIASPYTEYKATKPTVNGDKQAEQGQPLYHHFRCRSVDPRTGRAFTWVIHPTGRYTRIAVPDSVPTQGTRLTKTLS